MIARELLKLVESIKSDNLIEDANHDFRIEPGKGLTEDLEKNIRKKCFQNRGRRVLLASGTI